MASANAQAPKILIVGSGPSGLILALTLRRNGVPVRIIEKSTENRKGQRGAGIVPRSLELFEALGVYNQVHSRGLNNMELMTSYKMPGGVEILKEFKPAPRAEPTPATPYLNACLIGQNNLDVILRAELAKIGCEVELGVELVNLEQFDDHVNVNLLKRIPGAEPVPEEASFDWVIGSDGAKGVTRKLLGLKLIGETTTDRFVVGDIKLGGLAPEKFHTWGGMGDIMTLIRGTEDEGIFNFFIGGHNLPNPDEIAASEESVRDALKAGVGMREDIKFGEFTWLSPYTVNIRMTDSFQKGRAFLTGDAAHVHSPAGGQGLNTSIQDSFNLGWKLALVSKGLASPSLLETYNEERYPVVAHMLKLSTALLKQTLANNDEGWKRDGNIKQLGINYRWSSIAIDDDKAKAENGTAYDSGEIVLAGDRAPDAPGLVLIGEAGAGVRLFKLFSPTRHTVVIFAANTDYKPVLEVLQPYSGDLVRSIIVTPPGKGADISVTELSRNIVVEDRDGHAKNAYSGAGVFVIRPDGVVGARVRSADGVKRYFQAIFTSA